MRRKFTWYGSGLLTAAAIIVGLATPASAAATKSSIVNQNNGNCLSTATNGAAATVATCTGSAVQRGWEAVWTGEYYRGNVNSPEVYIMNVSNANAAKWVCLTLKGGETGGQLTGDPVTETTTCDAQDPQVWALVNGSAGVYEVVNVFSGEEMTEVGSAVKQEETPKAVPLTHKWHINFTK